MAGVAAFVIHAQRSALGLAAQLGAEIQNILGSDCWGVYVQEPAKRHQLIWAHLKRDCQKIVDHGGASVFVGQVGRQFIKKNFAVWNECRECQITRAQLRDKPAPAMNRLQQVLLDGAIMVEDKTIAAVCEKLLAVEPTLWTFVEVESIEPSMRARRIHSAQGCQKPAEFERQWRSQQPV